MLLIRQNYKFESYLQREVIVSQLTLRCCWYVKITNLKAIYNPFDMLVLDELDVVDTSKLQIWKLFTTYCNYRFHLKQMLLIRQNYKFESYLQHFCGVLQSSPGCCWYVKITNLKAIYNCSRPWRRWRWDVVDTSKLQIWKLFTTKCWPMPCNRGCCWYVKITNLKAIYNYFFRSHFILRDVVDTSKLQIWKLFTTYRPWSPLAQEMLLIRQNYKFESYLQRAYQSVGKIVRCCWYVKITNLKAIYNSLLRTKV